MIEYKTPTPEECRHALSETAKYRHLTSKYCYTENGVPGCGVDVASQGDRVVPWAMSFDLPPVQFNAYCGGHPAKGPIHLRGNAAKLPFDSNSLDFIYISHLLEDYADWSPLVSEWLRVIRPGGYMIILIPEKQLWANAIAAGQPPNSSHRHEGVVGEMSSLASKLGMRIIEDRLTNVFPGDYTILGVFQKQ